MFYVLLERLYFIRFWIVCEVGCWFCWCYMLDWKIWLCKMFFFVCIFWYRFWVDGDCCFSLFCICIYKGIIWLDSLLYIRVWVVVVGVCFVVVVVVFVVGIFFVIVVVVVVFDIVVVVVGVFVVVLVVWWKCILMCILNIDIWR